jgi:murein DD-endopeptidase MepM/ murein hydrolase activator NlpD
VPRAAAWTSRLQVACDRNAVRAKFVDVSLVAMTKLPVALCCGIAIAACASSQPNAPPAPSKAASTPKKPSSTHVSTNEASGTANDASSRATARDAASGTPDANMDDSMDVDARAVSGSDAQSAVGVGLSWPIDCKVDSTCASIAYPDVDGDGKAFDCGAPASKGQEGTEIRITQQQMDAGMAVFAAADGEVLWVFDDKYDRCPDSSQPDCAAPTEPLMAGQSPGYRVCTPSGNYCGQGTCCCFWCFNGGNVIVIRHHSVPGVFATRYSHLKRGSASVAPGDKVVRGQKIAEAAPATRRARACISWSGPTVSIG